MSFKILIVSRHSETENVYDGSYGGKTIVRQLALCSTVADFPTEQEALNAEKAIQSAEFDHYRDKTETRRLWLPTISKKKIK